MTIGQFTLNRLKYPNLLSYPQPVKLADSPISPLTIYTLGRFAVYRGSELIEDSAWKRRKAKSLFKLLLLAPQGQL